MAVSDNSATAFTIKQNTNNYLVIDTGDGGESVAIGTGVWGHSDIYRTYHIRDNGER